MTMEQWIKKNLMQFGVVILALIALNMVVYTVDETERVVVLQMGKPVREVKDAGLYFKLPWPFQSARVLEKRLLKYDATPREIITKDKKTGVVDVFSYFQIADGIRFLQRTGTAANAQGRLDDIVYSELRNDMGGRDFDAILNRDRMTIMSVVTDRSAKQMPEYGIQTSLIRMNRFELPNENKESVYNRMIAERSRQAGQYRSEGKELAQGIRSGADRQVAITVAEAEEIAQKNRGEGDAEAARLYNEAYGKDPEFFRIYRGLIAARSTLNGDVKFILKGNEPHLRAVFGQR